VADGAVARQRCRAWVRANHQGLFKQIAALKARRNRDLHEVQGAAQRRLAELNRRRAKEASPVEKHYPPRLAAIRRRRDAALRAAEAQSQRDVATAEERYSRDLDQSDGLYSRLTTDHRAVHEQRWNEMAAGWRQGVADVIAAAAEVNQLSTTLF